MVILNPREMKEPLECFKTLNIDKLYIKNLPEQLAYEEARKFFLEHKQYTHLILFADDAICTNDDIIILSNWLELKDYPVLGGVCNIDNEPENKGKWAITTNVVHPRWIDGTRTYDFIREEDHTFPHIIQVGWSGFPLMFIRRDIIEQVPFRDDREENGTKTGYAMDVTFCYDCSKLNIPILAHTGVRIKHLKGMPGSDKILTDKKNGYLIYQPQIGTGFKKFVYQPKNFKLVVDMIVLNEEDNIEECLKSLERIPDIDEVRIVDGTWMYNREFNSIDKTKELCQNWKSGVLEVKFMSSWKRWKNESEKRNWVYNWAEKDNEEEVWHFTIDADEEIILPKGQKYLALKPIIQKVKEDFIMLESGPHDDTINHPLQYFQIRLWRGNRGIHWHDGKSQVLHDGNCNIIMDWGNWTLHQKPYWFKGMIILNKWMYRDKNRLEATKKGLLEIENEEECSYRNNTKLDV